ncbi:hypothetical protein BD626DRAFT_492083 [Schizophyllum amplum]|uniref:Uncharacterized protein n=1 Tax=Schizophyllum amplum TaxID=97359 RepID=A0A550CID7_9AGAR|nr:hypothetical protein BD626DRAFT_492083 [Auriculariopsis ampla]
MSPISLPCCTYTNEHPCSRLMYTPPFPLSSAMSYSSSTAFISSVKVRVNGLTRSLTRKNRKVQRSASVPPLRQSASATSLYSCSTLVGSTVAEPLDAPPDRTPFSSSQLLRPPSGRHPYLPRPVSEPRLTLAQMRASASYPGDSPTGMREPQESGGPSGRSLEEADVAGFDHEGPNCASREFQSACLEPQASRHAFERPRPASLAVEPTRPASIADGRTASEHARPTSSAPRRSASYRVPPPAADTSDNAPYSRRLRSPSQVLLPPSSQVSLPSSSQVSLRSSSQVSLPSSSQVSLPSSSPPLLPSSRPLLPPSRSASGSPRSSRPPPSSWYAADLLPPSSKSLPPSPKSLPPSSKSLPPSSKPLPPSTKSRPPLCPSRAYRSAVTSLEALPVQLSGSIPSQSGSVPIRSLSADATTTTSPKPLSVSFADEAVMVRRGEDAQRRRSLVRLQRDVGRSASVVENGTPDETMAYSAPERLTSLSELRRVAAMASVVEPVPMEFGQMAVESSEMAVEPSKTRAGPTMATTAMPTKAEPTSPPSSRTRRFLRSRPSFLSMRSERAASTSSATTASRGPREAPSGSQQGSASPKKSKASSVVRRSIVPVYVMALGLVVS